MPEFRLSTGYGRELHLAGFRKFGKSPLEDLEDGVQWLVEQGRVDPKRVCIAGGSYGGYASLVAVAKTPSLYRCAWASFAVTDLVRQLTSPVGDTVYSDVGSAYWLQMAGDADKDRQMLDAASPVNMAGSITVPVKLVFGGEDRRVPIEQGTRMRSALERAKVPYEWLVFPDEGHGLGKLENRVKYYNEMLEFFGKNAGQAASKQP
jgi:dipeptidyl aminopeptidase/acylaminoacyl peptidase